MRMYKIRLLLLIAVICGLMACDNMDEASPQEDDFDPALLEQTEPEYSYRDFEEIENNYEFVVDTVGTWKISRHTVYRLYYKGLPVEKCLHTSMFLNVGYNF